MKNLFRGYYHPSKKEFQDLWENCLFIFDSNILLNLYRYSQKTSDEFVKIITSLSPRIWIPHQVALEYQKNRLKTIKEQMDVYDEIIERLNKLKAELVKEYPRHPYFDIKKVDSTFSKLITELNKLKEKHPNLFEEDTLRNEIERLFEGKIGVKYPPEKLEEIYKEGGIRFAKEIPPGYLDAKEKKGDNKYGDLVIWHQIIDEAIEIKQPVILVCDEKYEDWWIKLDGRLMGPRPELIEEFFEKTNLTFYMYRSDRFIKYAREYLKQEPPIEAIKEIREMREDDEKKRYEIYFQNLLQDKIKHEYIPPYWSDKYKVAFSPSSLEKMEEFNLITIRLGETAREANELMQEILSFNEILLRSGSEKNSFKKLLASRRKLLVLETRLKRVRIEQEQLNKQRENLLKELSEINNKSPS